MKENKVLYFESKEQLLAKARSYVDSVELLLEESGKAVPLLLKALKLGDADFKHEIIFVLGSFAKEEVAWPLYGIMLDPDEADQTRREASIQLSVIASFLKDPQPLVDRLLEDLKNEDPFMRLNAAFSLGWEGNAQAAIPLIDLLYDPDTRVQQTAVNALCNLRDDRVFRLMLERLKHGSQEQQSAILFNLWRFYSKRDEVISVYLEYLENANDDLRFDALVLLGSVTDVRSHLQIYVRSLCDRDCRIRACALKKLSELKNAELSGLKDKIRQMLADPEMEVKREAARVLKKC
jgi:HEAT repeat protein